MTVMKGRTRRFRADDECSKATMTGNPPWGDGIEIIYATKRRDVPGISVASIKNMSKFEIIEEKEYERVLALRAAQSIVSEHVGHGVSGGFADRGVAGFKANNLA
jgi:hypothetical protein